MAKTMSAESNERPDAGMTPSRRTGRLSSGQLTLLYGQLTAGIVSSLITGALLLFALYSMGSTGPLWTWYIGVALVALARFGLLLRFRRNSFKPNDTRFWFHMFTALSALSGAVWGIAIFLPQPSDYLQVMTTLLILAGMASGSTTIYASSLIALVAFNLPMFAITLSGLGRFSEFNNLIGLILLFMGMIFVSGSRTSRVFSKSLNLQLENDELIESLKADKVEISALNEELESRVADRTKQLQNSNTQLRREIDQRVKIQQSLARSESLYRSLYHANPSLFISIDADCEIESVNDYGLQFLGYQRDDLVGRPVSVLCDEDDAAELWQHLQDCLKQETGVQRWKTAFLDSTGAKIWVRILVRAVSDSTGDRHLQLVCEDVSEAHELERKLSFEATHDPLTQLYNRREFEDRLQRVLTDRRLDGSKYVLCLLDLDQFKVINDTCGHAAGDELLRRLGETVGKYIRSNDTFARLGGDEFGILMQNNSLDDAYKLVERLREAVEKFQFEWESNVFHLTASFGLTEISESTGTAADALREADAACYTAKETGRNRVCIHAEDDHTLTQQQSEIGWLGRIENAISQNRLHLALQPIIPTNGSAHPEMQWEVLLRLRDENGETVVPRAFLPAAERFGLMSRIDRWVVATTIKYVERTHTPSDLCRYSINLSRSAFEDESFFEYIHEQILASGAAAEQFCFEILESVAVANPDRASHVVKKLQSFGCKVALDDFGRGMASFDYLRSLPVNYLKIDGSLSTDIDENPISLTMSRAVTEIAHNLQMETIAKFVESEATARSLRTLGVDHLQGYAMGHPEIIPQEQKATTDLNA